MMKDNLCNNLIVKQIFKGVVYIKKMKGWRKNWLSQIIIIRMIKKKKAENLN